MYVLRTLRALIRLGRLHFLVGGFVLHALGVLIALYDGAGLNLAALLWGQLAITATQLMTHYANDYFDLDADRRNTTPTDWSGGSRVLVERAVSPRMALSAALVLAGVALAANLVLSVFIRPGVTTFAFLLLAQALAWFYSAPPLRLHSRGLGELTTMLVVTLFTPLAGYYLQTGVFVWLPVLATLPLCCIQFAMLLAIEFPDADGDRQAGKRTLVVRLGGQTAARLYIALVLLAFALLPFLVLAGLPFFAALALLIALPIAVWQSWRFARGEWLNPVHWNSLAFYTVLLLMVASLAQVGAFTLLLGL